MQGVSRGVLSSANDDDGGGSKARCASSSQIRGLYFLINDRSTNCMIPPSR
jgi:hypothetical protein